MLMFKIIILMYYMITYVIDVKNVERGLANPFLVRE